MTLSANVAIAFTGKYYVKVVNGEISGRGIKNVSCSIENTKKYSVTEKAYQALASKHDIDFVNVVN